MAWQPLTRWEDISATLDTPLSDEAIRLLNERDRDLQRYLSLNVAQSCIIYEVLAESDGFVNVADIVVPMSPSGQFILMFYGNVERVTGTFLGTLELSAMATFTYTGSTEVEPVAVTTTFNSIAATGRSLIRPVAAMGKAMPSHAGQKSTLKLAVDAGGSTSTFRVSGTILLLPSNQQV